MIYIVIPAYNEEKRIAKTLDSYISHIHTHQSPWHIIVVLNGCTDNTERIVAAYQRQFPEISYIQSTQKGKGHALTQGFKHALQQKDVSLVGFVDADCATTPHAFSILITKLVQEQKDIVIGSRYMPEQHTERVWYKAIGRKVVYHPLLYFLFGFSFYDIQCGAKLFTPAVLKSILPYITAAGWSIDPELLYLATKQRFSILELPIAWQDQKDSKFTVGGGISMIADLFRLRYEHRNR